MLVGWADSFIGNETEFLAALQLAEKAALQSDGVILGVRPTHPFTSYGYIELGRPLPGNEGAFRIARFEEKPDAERAQDFYNSGKYLWNPGISIWKVSTLLDLMRRYKPDHFAALQEVSKSLGTSYEAAAMEKCFSGLDREAIDTAIFEKAEHLATVPVELKWSDIGSWSALHEVLALNDENVTRGRVVSMDTSNCLIFGREERLIATLGISDLVIIDAGDVILVARKQDAECLKDLHAEVKVSGFIEYL